MPRTPCAIAARGARDLARSLEAQRFEVPAYAGTAIRGVWRERARPANDSKEFFVLVESLGHVVDSYRPRSPAKHVSGRLFSRHVVRIDACTGYNLRKSRLFLIRNKLFLIGAYKWHAVLQFQTASSSALGRAGYTRRCSYRSCRDRRPGSFAALSIAAGSTASSEAMAGAPRTSGSAAPRSRTPTRTP